MATLESINEKLRIAAEQLDLAANEIRDLPLEPTKEYISGIGRALADIFEIQHRIHAQRPDLRPAYLNEEAPKPDPELSDEQKAVVANLSQQTLDEIDRLLLTHASDNWRKVAWLVGGAMADHDQAPAGLSDILYSQRVRNLVETGQLEAQGNLQYMRFSEVRIPHKKK